MVAQEVVTQAALCAVSEGIPVTRGLIIDLEASGVRAGTDQAWQDFIDVLGSDVAASKRPG